MPLLVFDIFLFHWLWNRPRDETPEKEPATPVQAPATAVRPALRYTYPTDQQNLHEIESSEVYQPTASGRVESALYGSSRTVQRGGRLLSRFHAGIDIAPMRRDRRGRPKDKVYAVTEGKVAYINPVGGNSSYGIYVVLLHPDPIGDIYTLYAHLARVSGKLAEGQPVGSGDVLGIMGNSASTGIPMQRAHLHFEIGLIKNMRFHSWHREQGLIPDHGTFHGYNLSAVNPLALYRSGGAEILFDMKEHLRAEPPAFKIVVSREEPLDFFMRYPALWHGPPYEEKAMTLAVSEGGTPLWGRAATAAELAALGGRSRHVLEVDEDVLGRNGRRLVVRRDGEWSIGRTGERWLEILAH